MATVQVLLVDNTDEPHGAYLIAEPAVEVTTAQLPETLDHNGVTFHLAGYSGPAPMYLTHPRPGPLPTSLVEAAEPEPTPPAPAEPLAPFDHARAADPGAL